MAKPLTLVEQAERELQEIVERQSVRTATLSIRKGFPKRIINLIASMNNAEIDETDDLYIIKAPRIRVVRAELEASIGKLTDGRWRTLFVNRTGEINEFNGYEFDISVPTPSLVEKEEVTKEPVVQLNIRIPESVKSDIEELRKLLGDNYTQNAFVEDALKEFISNIKKEML